MNSKPSGLSFKLVLLGDGRVGKTSLVVRYVNNAFSEKQEATVQASYLTKRLVIEGVPITLAIWDTAGQERFHALGPIYYRDADALLVYDITDDETFIRVKNWVKELQQMAPKNIIMAIAANKSDLVRSKKFELQEAESYAASIGAKIFVTSAKLGSGIDEVFLDIATRVLQKKKSSVEGFSSTQQRKGMVIVDDEPEIEQQKCCS
ncbi:ras-related protein Rab-21-like isoform X2 [Macadamia integrifolia]|uniref:ras-related protein Rab-21-like isoform X2 n=1 Tax=Macadamia integrifolia TaxID=60698 RepID=UPI001C4E89AE|nr:ras-related protein Rab-21-like isoform X2 [Macadamia integrifolia]